MLIISGLGGEPQYDEHFLEWSQGAAEASATATGDAQACIGSQAVQPDVKHRAALKQVAELLKDGINSCWC